MFGPSHNYSMIGFAILAGTDNNGAKYFACFMVTSGIYPNVSQGVAWNGNNIGGSVKRGVGIAMHVGFVSTFIDVSLPRPC